MPEVPRNILIVDDHPGARETLSALLEPDGHHLQTAASGEEALALIEENPPDVILLDVMMPKMDGFEVCRRLKASAATRSIPVLLVTALDAREHLIEGYEAGAEDFVSKPVNGLELRARVRAFLRMKALYDDQEAMSQMREDMANIIVHDLRSPLNQISMATECLEETAREQGMEAFVKFIAEGVSEIESMVNNLLFYAKTQSESLLLQRQPVDLRDLLGERLERHRLLADSKQVTLALEAPLESFILEVDLNILARIIDNLVSNAIKHSPSASTVTLALREPVEGQLTIEVRDQGKGIPEDLRELIFQKFRSIVTNQAVRTSFGLGLYFCRVGIEAHGGSISVEDNQPGARFCLRLPLESALSE